MAPAGHTVFILGAGASMPFGFPSGYDLVRRVLEVRKSHVPEALNGLLCKSVEEEMGFVPKTMMAFQYGLLGTQVDSLDQFLALSKYSEFMDFGRFLIAAFLIPHEQSDRLFSHDPATHRENQNWYKLLRKNFFDPHTIKSLIDRPRVTFVTFNYDRSIEHYIWTILRHAYDFSSKDLADFIQHNVFHVHGQLGAYRGIGGANSRTYIPVRTIETIKLAMQGIKVIHEVDEFPRKDEILSRVENAERLVFLGMSYQNENLDKLFRGIKRAPPLVHGSCFGLSRAESDTARERVAHYVGIASNKVLIGGAENLGCYDFLRECVRFI